MQRFPRVFALAILALAAIIPITAHSAEPVRFAKGIVFDDANRNGSLDAGENGIAGVGVSNGSLIVQTAGDGGYRLPIDHSLIRH